jgi:putative ABC transport system substrate-binding protein
LVKRQILGTPSAIPVFRSYVAPRHGNHFGDRMKRREFITLLGSVAAVWPLPAHAQQRERSARIGVLMGIGENDPEAKPRVEALEQGFHDLGWVKGRNLQLACLIRQKAPERLASVA